MTIKELRNEIDRINHEIYENLDAKTMTRVAERKQELMRKSRVNTTNSGVIRYYLPKGASKEVVEDYLSQLINAMYDICGFCF